MKRILSFLLAAVVFLTVLVSFGGCASQKNNTLTIGQWLGMINNSFGMESYVQEEPYITSVGKEHKYFNTIQIASEWNVIDTDREIDPNDTLLWNDALITLVNAGAFTSGTATDDEKIEYAISHFSKGIRKYWMNREIDVSSASELLLVAQEQWASKTYEKTVVDVDYSEKVVNLSQDDVLVEKKSDGTLVVSGNLSQELKSGDVFILPNSGECLTTEAYKAEKIINENGKKIITVTNDELELGDFVDELYVEDTFNPDLTKAEIYDGNGNLVNIGSGVQVEPQSSTNINSMQIDKAAYTPTTRLDVVPLKSAKTSFTFETDSCKVEVSIKPDGLSAKIEVPLPEFGSGVKGYYEAEVSNFEITNKIDYSWFKLHSAEVKVDYQTKNTIGVKKEIKKESAVYAPKWTNGNGKFLTNLKNSTWKNAKTPGAKTIKLGSIKVASIGVASFSVDILAKLKVDGSLEIAFSETGCKGIEYKNGNCRVINTSDKDTDVKFKCKAEGTVSVVPTVNAFGFAIIGLKAEAGLGAEASLTLHLVDAGEHLIQETDISDLPPEVAEAMTVTGLSADAEEIRKLAEEQGGKFESETSTVDLHLDTCIDINVYFILRVGLEESTLAGKLLKGTKIKVEWELCGSKNAKICNLHIENFDFATAFSNIAFFTDKNQCTLKYKPFDEAEKIEEDATDNRNEDVSFGEVLVISDMKVVLQKGTCKTISVVQIPKGYELKDVVCESKEKKIATINEHGVISGNEEGSTTVIVKTKDGKYTCACSVTVVADGANDFTPLIFGDFNNSYYGVYAV